MNIELKKIKSEHAEDAAALIRRTFSEFVVSTFTAEGRAAFLSETNAENIVRMSNKCDCYVAIACSKIVGVIMAVKNRRISALFVDKEYQGRGIATALLNKIERILRKRGAKSIAVRSSLYAVEFYEKKGFKKTRGIVRSKKGWTYQPMKKLL